MSDDPRRSPGAGEKLPEAVEKKVARRLRARKEGHRGLWFGFGMFGLVGWAVAVPTLLGIALGWWLDRRFPGPPSWTLSFLLAGVALGCYNAWRWIQREGRHDRD